MIFQNYGLNCMVFCVTTTLIRYVIYQMNLKDTENIKLVFCAVKDTIMQSALKEFNLA